MIKVFEIGCSTFTKSGILFRSIKLKSSNNWLKAIIYDTVDEKIVCEIINKFDNQTYLIKEKYDNETDKTFLEINDDQIKQNDLSLSRYIIKLVK
jgi:hypothetical protein